MRRGTVFSLPNEGMDLMICNLPFNLHCLCLEQMVQRALAIERGKVSTSLCYVLDFVCSELLYRKLSAL
jgi:hypothetical protein